MISVIIPVYNSKPTLERCINSVKNQTVSDWECVIVNDGSTDDSWAEIDRLTEDDGRFCIVDCEFNQGLGYARNTGMMYARADKLFFLDSDDYIDRDALEYMEKAAASAPAAGAIVTPKYNYFVDTRRELKSSIEPLGLCTANDPYVFGSRRCDLGYSTGVLYVKKNLSAPLVFPKVKVFEDMPTNMEQLMAGTKYFITARHLYHYIRQKGSLLDTPLSIDDANALRKLLAEHARRHKPSDEIFERFSLFLENALQGRIQS